MDIDGMKRTDIIDALNQYCEQRKTCTAFDGGDETDCPFCGNDIGDDFEHMNDDQLIKCLEKIGVLKDVVDDKRPVVSKKPDMVEHPAHYNQGDIECIDAIKSAVIGKTGIEAVCVANVIKYLWRYETKNGLEDVKKAQFYLNRLIKEFEDKNK